MSCPNAGAGLNAWTIVQSRVPLALGDYDANIPDNHCVRTIHILETALMSELQLIQKP